MSISRIVASFFEIYFYLILVRIFLTWVPSIDWSSPFFRAVAIVSDVVLEPFRKIVPPLGGLDFSPIIALLVLQLIEFALVRGLSMLGL